MADRWLGIKVIGTEIICIGLEMDDSKRTIIRDLKFSLQQGARPEAYAQAYKRIVDFLQQNNIDKVAMVSSARNPKGTSDTNLATAELRGVVQLAGVHAHATVSSIKMSAIKSRKGILGPLATTKYIDDDAVWATAVTGNLKKYCREAAVVAIAAQKMEST